MLDRRKLPSWVLLAEHEMEASFGLSLFGESPKANRVSPRARTAILLAALEADPKGERAVKLAVYDTWRAIRQKQGRR